MLEATLTKRKGRPNGGPVDGRLLNFLEGVIGWKEARNPSLSETAVHPTVWLHRAASVGRRRWGSPSCVFRIRVCQYILLSIPRGALGKPVDKTKCQTFWTLFPFPFSFSDCFNCSVVVLMDLRPWSGSCLSDFQLLFVNNLKRKKKRNFTFWRQTCVSFLLVQTLYLTLGVLYSFLPFLLENNVKWFHNVKRKKNCHYDQTHSLFCSNNGIQSTQSRDSAVEMLFLYLVWAFPFFPVLICKRKCLFCVNLCCTM